LDCCDTDEDPLPPDPWEPLEDVLDCCDTDEDPLPPDPWEPLEDVLASTVAVTVLGLDPPKELEFPSTFCEIIVAKTTAAIITASTQVGFKNRLIRIPPETTFKV